MFLSTIILNLVNLMISYMKWKNLIALVVLPAPLVMKAQYQLKEYVEIHPVEDGLTSTFCSLCNTQGY